MEIVEFINIITYKSINKNHLLDVLLKKLTGWDCYDSNGIGGYCP